MGIYGPIVTATECSAFTGSRRFACCNSKHKDYNIEYPRI